MSGWGRYTADMARAARRFRQQVWSPKHPERRIQRIYRCCNQRECQAGDVQTEAHHLSYKRPYRIVWVCRSCHRRIETGDLKIKAIWVHDYTSLVRSIPKRWKRGTVTVAAVKEEVPF